MVSFNSKRAASLVRAALTWTMLAASGGGCTLIVGDQLADKPSDEMGGQGGSGGAASSVSASSSAAQSSSATGGIECAPDTANCDGANVNGCEAKLKSDAKNCGACNNACQAGEHCKDRKCE